MLPLPKSRHNICKNAEIITRNSLLLFHGQCFLRTAIDARAAFDAVFVLDGPGFVGSVYFDSANRAFLRAESAVYAALAQSNHFFCRLFEAEAFLRTFADTQTALYAFGFVHFPGLGRTVNGERACRADTNTHAAEYTAVAAGQLAFDFFFDSVAGGNQIVLIQFYHVVVLGETDGFLAAEVLTHTAEGTGGQIEFVTFTSMLISRVVFSSGGYL